MVLIEKFCGCCSLEVGGIVLGFYGTIKSVILTIIFAIYLSFVDRNEDKLLEIVHATSIDVEYVRLGLALLLAFSIINLCISAMVIIGTVQKKHLLLLPWIIVNFFDVLFVGFGLLGSIVNSFCNPGTSLLLLILFAFNLYLWFIIVALYNHLKKSYSYGANQVIWKAALNNSQLPPYTRESI